MRRILTIITAAGLLFGLSAQKAEAALERYEFDKAHTQIVFFADHLGFSKSKGEFYDFDGHFMIDRENPENSSVEVTIDTDSLVMKTQRWTDHLKNEDFFDVTQYPEMIFRSTAVELTGEETANVAGELTMLGVTRPVVLHVTHNKSAARDAERFIAGFTATAKLDRADWGMTYGAPAMATEVELIINIEGLRVSEAPASENAAEAADEAAE